MRYMVFVLRRNSSIAGKSIVSFLYANSLKVDLTACLGVQQGHRPSCQTLAVREALHQLPVLGQRLTLLTLDMLKRRNACWNRRGSVNAYL